MLIFLSRTVLSRHSNLIYQYGEDNSSFALEITTIFSIHCLLGFSYISTPHFFLFPRKSSMHYSSNSLNNSQRAFCAGNSSMLSKLNVSHIHSISSLESLYEYRYSLQLNILKQTFPLLTPCHLC